MYKKVEEKIIYQNIKGILFDVDGVLTDGKITFDSAGKEIKSFNVKDGQLISFFQEKGIVFGAISGRKSKALDTRLKELKINFYRTGVKDKELAFVQFNREFNITPKEICFIGDDIIDIKPLKMCGLAVCPLDASDLIKPFVDVITKNKGGEGVLREILDKLLIEKGWINDLLEN
jgi:3-deoxy-D-manno-octulosonate 8-phosphate phosphatase (KDO 8-P phosphatase)